MEEQNFEQDTEQQIIRVKKRKKSPMVLAIGLAIVAIAGYLIFDATKYQSTEDAFIETHTVQVSPKVSGQIVKVYVDDNQHVNAGDLVAEINQADYSVKLKEATAKQELALYKQKAAKANYEAVSSEIALAKKNYDRYKSLYTSGAVSKQELDSAKTKFDAANAQLTQASEGLLSVQNNRMADAELKQLEAVKQLAELNLSYTKIYAPQSGSVTGKNVTPGTYVMVGQPLFSIVPDDVWVIANFKESQLANMKIGQEVELKIDAYPNKKFKGRIESFQRSSGAKASLFPPENAVGSFVKIVQRIPVKIVFDEKINTKEYNIIPGMSVEPRVKVK